MAVIREKFQFRNQKIGVTRVDTGEEQLWNTVSRAADTLTAQAFQRAEIKAKETGAELAEQKSKLALRTIDPETGKPVAYQMPESFGTVAQQAFEKTLDTRYIRSVEQEIRDKGNELYLKYFNDPQGPEKYSLDMEDYVGQMTKNANFRFQNMVRDTGAAYIASTKLNLLTKRQERIVQQERGLIRDDVAFSVETMQSMAKGAGFDLIDPNSITSQHIESVYGETIQQLDTAVEAGILLETTSNTYKRQLDLALPEAMLQNTVNIDTTYEEDGKTVGMSKKVAADIESSLSSQRVLESLPDALKPVVQTILDSQGYLKNKPEMIRRASELRNDLYQEIDTKIKKTELEIQVERVGNKDFGIDSSLPISQKAADVFISQNTQGLMEEEDPDIISYMASPDSLDNKALQFALYGRRIIPASMKVNFNRLRDLTIRDAQEAEVIMNHYRKAANAEIGGKTINLLTNKGGIDDETDAFLASVDAIAQIRGDDNIITIISSLKDMEQQPEKFEILAKASFGEINPEAKNADTLINTYLGQKFPQDYTMLKKVRPFVKNLINAGLSFEAIDEKVTGYFESNYIETDGLIIDRNNPQGTRSMFAFGNLMTPEEEGIFVTELQKMLNEKFGYGTYTFSKFAKGDNLVKLVPINQNKNTPSTFDVKINVKGKKEPVIEQVKSYDFFAVIKDKNGELKFLADPETKGPLVVNTGIAAQAIANQRGNDLADEIADSMQKAINIEKAKEDMSWYEDVN